MNVCLYRSLSYLIISSFPLTVSLLPLSCCPFLLRTGPPCGYALQEHSGQFEVTKKAILSLERSMSGMQVQIKQTNVDLEQTNEEVKKVEVNLKDSLSAVKRDVDHVVSRTAQVCTHTYFVHVPCLQTSQYAMCSMYARVTQTITRKSHHITDCSEQPEVLPSPKHTLGCSYSLVCLSLLPLKSCFFVSIFIAFEALLLFERVPSFRPIICCSMFALLSGGSFELCVLTQRLDSQMKIVSELAIVRMNFGKS